MYKNYFKIVIRNFKNNKLYSFVKIGGFAVSIAACILIFLYILNETSYDSHYPDADRIYRVVFKAHYQGNDMQSIHFPAPLAKTLKKEFPEIEKCGRYLNVELFGSGSKEIRPANTEQNFHETGVIYADQELIDLLQIPMVKGNREDALSEPNTVLITESIAKKYFPGKDALGEFLILDNDLDNPMKIGGIMEDVPVNSHIHYNILMTLEKINFYGGEQENWSATNYYTYVLLHPGTDITALESKMREVIIGKYWGPVLAPGVGEETVNSINFKLQPIKDIYLKSTDIDDSLVHGDIRYIWIFGTIAFFILLIACINFVNLSTARSANRAKEVGLRKTVGSPRRNLINQFLTESLFYSFSSFAIGIIVAHLFLPLFNAISGKALSIPWTEWWFIPLLILMAFVTGIMAGVYPSLYLSGFKPANVLKGSLSLGSKSSSMRSTLVIFQFTTSIILIIGSFVINSQMDYILNKKLGFDKEQILVLYGTNTIGDQVYTFKDEIKKLNVVKNASVSGYIPVSGTIRNGNSFWKEGRVNQDKLVSAQIWRVDNDYINTLGINIIEGRNFNVDRPADNQGIIISKKMAEDLSLDNPVGERITNGGSVWEVIGVVDDFHFESLRMNIRGIALVLGNSPSIVSVKINTGEVDKAITSVKEVWDEFYPNQSVRYSFMDESFAGMYDDVKRTGWIFSSFTYLAIIVACLGLFALSAFMAEQRGKEISIRQVVGASFKNVFNLLSLDFLKLILISVIIAAPFAWYFMQLWLETFAYHVDFRWRIYLFTVVIAFLISMVTISYHTISAVIKNPADLLRTE